MGDSKIDAENVTERSRLLEVQNLTVQYGSSDGTGQCVLNDLSLHLAHGETVGLLGESGCGKTTLALALLGLLPRAAKVTGGFIRFHGHEMLRVDEQALQKIRGAEVSLIFQEPALALNPVMRVGDQIAEVVHAHSSCDRGTRRKVAESVLADVRLCDARIYSAYPHQLSAGQRQRVVIAQALACRPALLIADEPTSALDNTIQMEILDLLRDLKRRLQVAILFITHNPALLVRFADRVLVMYAGRVVEEGSLAQVYRKPRHPYTRGLLRSIPPLPGNGQTQGNPLPTIAGKPFSFVDPARGCSFEPRCPDRVEDCTMYQPAQTQLDDGGRVRCFKYGI